MSVLEAILLGLVQGLTEFLPVSSSGHLTIGKEILGIETENLTFEVVVHAATVLSTIVAFRKDILDYKLGIMRYEIQAYY
jgi:undecaprenyl-diphosphatase